MTEYERQLAERVLFSLVQAAEGLECGRRYQVTRFYPLARFCTGAAGHTFLTSLLSRVRVEVEGCGVSPLVPLTEKLGLLDETIAAFASVPDEARKIWLAAVSEHNAPLLKRLQILQPEWKRIWVHANRRLAADKDLLLAEYALRGNVANVLALYLTSYENYRYHLLPDAATRVRWIAAFWSETLLGEELSVFFKRVSAAPPALRPRRPLSPLAQRQARARTLRKMERWPATTPGSLVPATPLDLPVEPPPPFELSEELIGRLDKLETTLPEEEDRDELDDPVEEKLARAHYNMVMAWRIFRGNGDPGQVATRLKGAKNRCCEVWLYHNGHPAHDDDNRDYLASWFYVRAPAPLLRKAQILEEKLTGIFYRNIYTDQAFADRVTSCHDRRAELAACLAETLTFYEHTRNGTPLPGFRWERDDDFAPGQWVLKLQSALMGCDEHGRALSRWHTSPYQVMAVDARETVVRRGNSRNLERYPAGSLFLWPTALQEDLSSPASQRRIWFDLRPQLRQVPLVLPQFLGIGESIDRAADFDAAVYETCPCCGYPVKLSQRLHPMRKRSPTERRSGCVICDWVDRTGLDGVARQSVNFGYTLTEARENFTAMGSIFRPEDGEDFERHRTEPVKRLKAPLCSAFDAMMDERNRGQLYLLWWRAEGLRQELLDLYNGIDGIEQNADALPEAVEPGVWIDDLIDHASLVVAVYRSPSSTILRIRNRKGKNREITAEWGSKILPLPRIDIWTPFFARRTWFESHPEILHGHLLCPCCGYPTLWTRGRSEYCFLCHWQDIGQDDYDAEQALDHSNGTCSLAQARRNFAESLTAANFEGTGGGQLKTGGLRHENLFFPNLYDRLITAENFAAVERVWREIDEYRQGKHRCH